MSLQQASGIPTYLWPVGVLYADGFQHEASAKLLGVRQTIPGEYVNRLKTYLEKVVKVAEGRNKEDAWRNGIRDYLSSHLDEIETKLRDNQRLTQRIPKEVWNCLATLRSEEADDEILPYLFRQSSGLGILDQHSILLIDHGHGWAPLAQPEDSFQDSAIVAKVLQRALKVSKELVVSLPNVAFVNPPTATQTPVDFLAAYGVPLKDGELRAVAGLGGNQCQPISAWYHQKPVFEIPEGKRLEPFWNFSVEAGMPLTKSYTDGNEFVEPNWILVNFEGGEATPRFDRGPGHLLRTDRALIERLPLFNRQQVLGHATLFSGLHAPGAHSIVDFLQRLQDPHKKLEQIAGVPYWQIVIECEVWHQDSWQSMPKESTVRVADARPLVPR